jgi:cytoskeletal protein RodZ
MWTRKQWTSMATVSSDDSKKGNHSPAGTQNDGLGIGELLRSARERRGLTLEQVSREIKIPRRHLEALEHGTLAALPPFYQRAEIRTYARALNLDPGQVLACLERGPAPSVVATALPKPTTPNEPASSRNHRALIASAFVLMAVVFWLAMPQNLSLGVQTGNNQVSGSAGPIVSPPGTPSAQPDVAIDRTDFGRDAKPAAASERVVRVGLDRTEAQPTVAADDNPSTTTKRIDSTTAKRVDPIATKPVDPIPTKPVDERSQVGRPTELIVTTQPAGARVTVDGIGWGITPVTIRHLTPGAKRIRVSKDGYATTERVVSVAQARTQTTDIPLTIKQ